MKTLTSYDLESIQALPLHTREERCDSCYGIGEVKIYDREQLSQFFRNNDLSFRKAMRLYREWKISGTVGCISCCGQGSWEIYY